VTPESKRFAKRVFVAVMIIAAIAALAYAISLLLLVFAGVLLAVMLRAAGTWLAEHSRLSNKWSMAIVLAAFAGILLGTLWMFGVQIANQADQLFSAVSQAFAGLQQKVREYRVAGLFISDAGHVNLGAPAKAAASGLLWSSPRSC